MTDRRHGRKLRETTGGGSKPGLGKERKKELTSKRAPINPTLLPRTHKLAIDLRPPIAANSPPKPPSDFETVTAVLTKMLTDVKA